MPRKEFIQHDDVRDNTLKIAYKMYKEDGFIPDVIYASLRGGVYLANVFSEFYKLVCEKENHKPVLYAAISASSRTLLIPGENSHVNVGGWTYPVEYLRAGDKILLCDDIYDTGNTMNIIGKTILAQGIERKDLKVVVYDYKIPEYKKMPELEITPDYCCRKHILKSEQEETWIHYMGHEYVGLTHDEIISQYKDPEVQAILDELK